MTVDEGIKRAAKSNESMASCQYDHAFYPVRSDLRAVSINPAGRGYATGRSFEMLLPVGPMKLKQRRRNRLTERIKAANSQ